jgi:hypothetical protein
MMAQAYLVWPAACISSRTPQNLKAKVKKDLKGILPACGHSAERGKRDASIEYRGRERLDKFDDVGAVATLSPDLRKENIRG